MKPIVEHRIIFLNDPRKKEKKKTPVRSFLYGLFGALLSCLTAVCVLLTLAGRLIVVDGTSMQPTLQHNDRLLASELLYTPDYGDVVIISRNNGKQPIVKRVIALEGDRVHIDFESHAIFVNDKKIEDYGIFVPIATAGDVIFPVTVPQNCVFVLGDNRNGSLDSRWSEIGFVSQDMILGKAVVRLYPLDTAGIIE